MYIYIKHIHIVRKVWKDYYPVVDAIVFIVDCSKTDRFEEVEEELSVSNTEPINTNHICCANLYNILCNKYTVKVAIELILQEYLYELKKNLSELILPRI